MLARRFELESGAPRSRRPCCSTSSSRRAASAGRAARSPRSSSTRRRASAPSCSRKSGCSPISRPPTEKLLPLVLAGQPELSVRLNDPALRQLKQRVALRCEIAPFDAAGDRGLHRHPDPHRGRRSRPAVHARGGDADSRAFAGNPADDQRHVRQRAARAGSRSAVSRSIARSCWKSRAISISAGATTRSSRRRRSWMPERQLRRVGPDALAHPDDA